ncbi:Longin domain [Dillenia turbinata]|uniref:Longin domain n=1 Tax=Dillenia turbinata TaxID=194707 RepID=A0AAN8ZCR7_9MAGN
MGQEQFIYSFVARGTMILAEFTEFTGNFPSIAAQCLQKLPSSNNKFTYNCDHHTFNFLVQDGYAYCIVAKESVGKQLCIAFLERIRADFKNRYGGGKADTATAKSLNKDFGPIMKEQMQYVIDHAEEIGKLSKVKAQVSEVKSIMMENIDKALERGENLTTLADKTETLRPRIQKARDPSSEKDVVPKHEDKVGGLRNPVSSDPGNLGVYLSRVRLHQLENGRIISIVRTLFTPVLTFSPIFNLLTNPYALYTTLGCKGMGNEALH